MSALGRALLAGEQTSEEVAARVAHLLGRDWDGVRRMAARYIESTAGKVRPRHSDVMRWLSQDRRLVLTIGRLGRQIAIQHWLTPAEEMLPVRVAVWWNLPRIASPAELADWLWLDSNDLEWFSDLKGLGAKQSISPARHYTYRVLRKASGGLRIVESPKRRLKKLQRKMLRGILEHIPPHAASHAFVKGRSIKTFADPHSNQSVVLRMDLRNFFATIGRARVQTIFRMLGYPDAVADLLGGMCTNIVPRDVLRSLSEVEAGSFLN